MPELEIELVSMNKARLVQNPWLRVNDVDNAHLNAALVEMPLKVAHRRPLACVEKTLIRLGGHTTVCLDPGARLFG